MNLVSKQREERRERILHVARRLIAERGYEGVTMRELADESLVSVPTLYNLFGGKNELLFAAVESFFLELFGRARDRGKGEGLARVLAVCQTLGGGMPLHAEYARSIMAFFGGTTDSTALREFVAREMTSEIIEGLDEMRARRQLVDWVDLDALGERLASLMIMTGFEWANQHISDAAIEPAMRFGAAAMLLGFARGKAANELVEIVRANQDAAVVPRREEAKRRRGVV